MTIKFYIGVGTWSKILNIEYDSICETDRAETDKYVSRMIQKCGNFGKRQKG